jgi:hypothetical protein
MISTTPRAFVAGVRRAAAFALLFLLAAFAACSSDPPSELGSDNDLLGSRPGNVFEDTLELASDTVLTYYSVINTSTVLDLGRAEGYDRAMVIQIKFPTASPVSVKSADLRLTALEVDSISARFYRLADTYIDGDSIPSLDTLGVIVDPETNSANRILVASDRFYALPPSLVQGWLDGSIEGTAIAVVYNGSGDETATFRSVQADSARPQLSIVLSNNSPASYFASADADFVRATAATSNLVVSDGHVRRIYIRVPIDSLNQDAAIHNAHVRFHVVDGSVVGTNVNLIAYIPTSDDITNPDFLSGQLVTTRAVGTSAKYVDFPITNALALMLQGTLDDNGFVIRFDAENTSIRQVEFYGTSAPDSLRPRVYVTSSAKADFHPKRSP